MTEGVLVTGAGGLDLPAQFAGHDRTVADHGAAVTTSTERAGVIAAGSTRRTSIRTPPPST
ncbi:hypothetical protein Vlu01_10800 [Micromonospora lutea]|uniref:Uncharacterized protein n=1 Tax=Micromonospora lutea TaxID=419825 RepID=A0ABQ4IRD2_9ACTN|nr:hypothetical protein Vlu01_10800 [Micromonospora lutea]